MVLGTADPCERRSLDDIGRIASAAGVPLLELTAEEGTLEQAYFRLTAAETEFAAQPQEA